MIVRTPSVQVNAPCICTLDFNFQRPCLYTSSREWWCLGMETHSRSEWAGVGGAADSSSMAERGRATGNKQHWLGSCESFMESTRYTISCWIKAAATGKVSGRTIITGAPLVGQQQPDWQDEIHKWCAEYYIYLRKFGIHTFPKTVFAYPSHTLLFTLIKYVRPLEMHTPTETQMHKGKRGQCHTDWIN